MKGACVWATHTLNRRTCISTLGYGVHLKRMIDLMLVKRDTALCARCEGSERSGINPKSVWWNDVLKLQLREKRMLGKRC